MKREQGGKVRRVNIQLSYVKLLNMQILIRGSLVGCTRTVLNIVY